MMLRSLTLAVLALMCAGAALAASPLTQAPPMRESTSTIPTAIYKADGSLWDPGSTSPSAGTQEQDVTESRALSTATLNAQQVYTLNGQATFGFDIPNLSASGATLTFEQTYDGTNWRPINEVNSGTGQATATRSADGGSALCVEGARGVRIRVSTAGAGNITIGSTISVRSRCSLIRAPVPGLAATAAAIGPVPVVGRAVTALVGKAGPGNLYGYHATFGSGGQGYLAVLDAAAAPLAGAAIAPIECMPIASLSGYRTREVIPDRYATGIVVVATTSCATYTAVSPAPPILAVVVQ